MNCSAGAPREWCSIQGAKSRLSFSDSVIRCLGPWKSAKVETSSTRLKSFTCVPPIPSPQRLSAPAKLIRAVKGNNPAAGLAQQDPARRSQCSTASRRPPSTGARPSFQPPCVTASSCSDSSSVNNLERIRKRCPVGDSTLNPLPRPGTTSTVRWVWLQ